MSSTNNPKVAAIVGATGLVGRALLENLLESTDYQKVISFTRRKTSQTHPKLQERVLPLENLENEEPPGVDVAFCALGTTMKKAGSKAAFKEVDYAHVVRFARLVKRASCPRFLMVSAMGADPKSLVFYNRVKGEVEQAVRERGFKATHILRPSLLLGDRKEARLGEDLGKKFSQFVNPVIPANYRAIQATQVAYAMYKISLLEEQGFFIHENKELLKII